MSVGLTLFLTLTHFAQLLISIKIHSLTQRASHFFGVQLLSTLPSFFHTNIIIEEYIYYSLILIAKVLCIAKTKS